MQKLPEDGDPAGVVLVGIEVPVVEVGPVVERPEVERVLGGLPRLFIFFLLQSAEKQLDEILYCFS
jgi:hypothetical protein